MGDDPKPVPGYKLADADKLLIRGSGRDRFGKPSNIAAVHFDGPVLMQMVRAERDNPRAPQRRW